MTPVSRDIGTRKSQLYRVGRGKSLSLDLDLWIEGGRDGINGNCPLSIGFFETRGPVNAP